MLRSLKVRVYGWLGAGRIAGWRRALAMRLYTLGKGQIAFSAFLTVAVILFGWFAYVAYAKQVRIDAERQRRTDLSCLARNVYYEARGEPAAGQRAVAEVTMNRVEAPQFPDTVCDVVFEKSWDRRRNRYVGAFSWTEFESVPEPDGIEWERAIAASATVYDGDAARTVGDALFYHADWIEPRWAKSQTRVTKIGRHIFYE